VLRGDTLVTVADRFGVSAEDLRRWNRLSSNSIRPGTTLRVAEPVKLAPSVRTHSKVSRRNVASHPSSKAPHATPTASHTSSSHAAASSTRSAKTTSTKTTHGTSKTVAKAAR
jgi:membrane-bound lytic murein transglycosylase D